MTATVRRPPRTSPPRSAPHDRRRRLLGRCSPCPGSSGCSLFFVAPLYVVLAVVFGGVDPVFRTVIPVWNPILWSSDQPIYVLTHIVGEDGIFGPALLRTAVYVLTASVLCLLIAFPIAYYVARLAGRWKGLLLTLLIAPFWISYMMRMLAWVNLLANDGIVNRVLSLGGVLPGDTEWLSGKSAVVVLGLVYGYVPYMIIPLYAGLDRLPSDLIESARDLGASRFWAFWRVTWPMSRPVVVASVLLTCLPMLGDYFTSDLLSGSPSTSMVGNLINNTVLTPGQTGQAGAFVLLVLLVSLLPMIYYVRSVSRNDGALAMNPDHARGGATRGASRGCWRPSRSATWCGRCCRCSSPCCSRSTTAARGRSGRASRCAGTTATPQRSVWHDDTLQTALFQTLKLGRPHHAGLRAARRRPRDRAAPLARPGAQHRQLDAAAVVRAARDPAGRGAAARRDQPGPAVHPRHHRAGDRPGDLPAVLPGDPGARPAGDHRRPTSRRPPWTSAPRRWRRSAG